MNKRVKPAGTAAFLLLAGLLLAARGFAADIRVMTAGEFAGAYRALTPEFERSLQHTVQTSYAGPSPDAQDAIPRRLERGEPADVVILAAPALDELIRRGLVLEGSRVDLARSRLGLAVKAGARKPDIAGVEALKAALLQARSIAYPAAAGPSSAAELFSRLGIADQLRDKSRRVEGERVGAVVARGEAEIGLQELGELLPVAGIDVVGPLPPDVQRATVLSAGIAKGSTQPEAAKALIRFLASPAAAGAVTKSGLEPMTPH